MKLHFNKMDFPLSVHGEGPGVRFFLDYLDFNVQQFSCNFTVAKRFEP
jgi:hypothetical protein